MPVAAFIVPQTGTGGRREAGWRAKYQGGDPRIVESGQVPFGGGEDTILLINADQTYLDVIAADPECQLIIDASNIDDPLTAPQVTAIQAFLEARGVPADWLVAGETRRMALRGVLGMFKFSRRMEGRFGQSWKKRLVTYGVTLNSEWQSLPTALQIELLDVAASFGRFGLNVPDTMTMRQILASMGNMFQSQTLAYGTFRI